MEALRLDIESTQARNSLVRSNTGIMNAVVNKSKAGVEIVGLGAERGERRDVVRPVQNLGAADISVFGRTHPRRLHRVVCRPPQHRPHLARVDRFTIRFGCNRSVYSFQSANSICRSPGTAGPSLYNTFKQHRDVLHLSSEQTLYSFSLDTCL